MWMEDLRINEIVEKIKSKHVDFEERTIPFHRGELKVLYIRELVDHKSLSDFIIKPLVDYATSQRQPLTAEQARERGLCVRLPDTAWRLRYPGPYLKRHGGHPVQAAIPGI